MMVSIVIPVYNAEKYLRECIESCLRQTYKNMEKIGVDDGSTDNSGKILETYAGKIKIIKKENGGTPTALNAGIKAMTGEWFKWLSADDVLYENAVETLIGEAELLGERAKSCIFYSSYDIIDKDSAVVGEFIEADYNQLDRMARNAILLDHFVGNGNTSLIHRSVFDRFGLFDETIGYKEDYEFWLRCCVLNDCDLFLVPKKLAKYRVHVMQLTKKKVRQNLDQVNKIKKMTIEKLPEEKRKVYLAELAKYQRDRPIKIRIRRKIRDLMIRVLPKDASGKIIESYMGSKKPGV